MNVAQFQSSTRVVEGQLRGTFRGKPRWTSALVTFHWDAEAEEVAVFHEKSWRRWASLRPEEVAALAAGDGLRLDSEEVGLVVTPERLAKVVRWLYDYGRVALKAQPRSRPSALAHV